MAVIVRPFGSRAEREAVEPLLSSLAARGQLPLGSEALLQLLSAGGLVALQQGRCVAAAAVELADGAEEADLVWLAEPDATSDVRDTLLAAARRRARALGATSLLCYLSEADAANLAFFDAVGAVSVPGYARWVAELSDSAEPEPNEGLSLLATDDAQVLLAAMQAAWGDLPGHKPATPAAVAEAIRAFGVGRHLVLLQGTGQPVGLVRGLMTSTDEAYVDAPGLAPGLRQAECYALLARIAMQRLSQEGAKTAVMESWGDPPEATAGWRSAGWTRKRHMPARRVALT